jgi:hypothetical protein
MLSWEPPASAAFTSAAAAACAEGKLSRRSSLHAARGDTTSHSPVAFVARAFGLGEAHGQVTLPLA